MSYRRTKKRKSLPSFSSRAAIVPPPLPSPSHKPSRRVKSYRDMQLTPWARPATREKKHICTHINRPVWPHMVPARPTGMIKKTKNTHIFIPSNKRTLQKTRSSSALEGEQQLKPRGRSLNTRLKTACNKRLENITMWNNLQQIMALSLYICLV